MTAYEDLTRAVETLEAELRRLDTPVPCGVRDATGNWWSAKPTPDPALLTALAAAVQGRAALATPGKPSDPEPPEVGTANTHRYLRPEPTHTDDPYRCWCQLP